MHCCFRVVFFPSYGMSDVPSYGQWIFWMLNRAPPFLSPCLGLLNSSIILTEEKLLIASLDFVMGTGCL